MTKKKLFVWTCDYSESTGEGKLARLFIKKLNQKNEYNLIFNQKKIINYKYLSTLMGIIYCWNKFLKDETAHSLGLFQIFITEIWLRLFFDNDVDKYKDEKLNNFINQTN